MNQQDLEQRITQIFATNDMKCKVSNTLLADINVRADQYIMNGDILVEDNCEKELRHVNASKGLVTIHFHESDDLQEMVKHWYDTFEISDNSAKEVQVLVKQGESTVVLGKWLQIYWDSQKISSGGDKAGIRMPVI